ncbi:DNA/RNA helicase domain-containing protein [Promicromonospora sp. Populi]|uniref:DNA/RNA helicase domain-containing protein n=1 Tax=Promicromonospora sp. Populi TaxID=3239420 RepID=UPI0034E2844E
MVDDGAQELVLSGVVGEGDRMSPDAPVHSTTGFEIEDRPYNTRTGAHLRERGGRYTNWPVVYVLSRRREVYVGETVNVAKRMDQHRRLKGDLKQLRIVLADTFHKSVCLDLESRLITYLAGDGCTVRNRNGGITDADYYRRSEYQETFSEIFDALRERGVLKRSIREIENSDLFKYSPFKALTPNQASVVESVAEGLLDDIEAGRSTTSVIQGEPGTGKTIVGVFLLKLLKDIADAEPEPVDGDAMFSDLFTEGYPDLVRGKRLGLVVPQQSLRETIKRVFRTTAGLNPSMVLSPFAVGNATKKFDLLVVDEAHRLGQRASQANGAMNKQFAAINKRLFGEDDLRYTQLDWIRAQSGHQVLMLDTEQSVMPADLPQTKQKAVVEEARRVRRLYTLTSQMRVQAGADYVQYVRDVLADAADEPGGAPFFPYDLRMFDDFSEMVTAVRRKDREHGLARLVAGYAWPWLSRDKPTDDAPYDIEIDGKRLRWNRKATDWVDSSTSLDEVGSIHTIQGYDLNYAGVIIGPDLRLDERGRIAMDRTNYFDRKGQANNHMLGIDYTDDDLLRFVRNVYGVLLTRGMLGTYVYVCDPALREKLRPYFSTGRQG